MKRADVAIGSQLLQGDVFRQVIVHVLLGLFDRGQVVFFQPGVYGLYGAVVGKTSDHFFKNVHHEIIHFQLMGAGGPACLQEGEMQLFDLRVGSYQQRLHVFIGKEPMRIAVQQALDVFVKFLPEENDGAGVGDLSGMLNGVFIPGLAYQYRTGVGIKRVAKSIVVKITRAGDAEGEVFIVLGFRPGAFIAPAPEIADLVVIRREQYVYFCFHIVEN